jgi:hypothetical protein
MCSFMLCYGTIVDQLEERAHRARAVKPGTVMTVKEREKPARAGGFRRENAQ